MILECHNAFGNLEPGDEIEVPDDSEFDTAYFHEKNEAAPPPPEDPPAEEETPAPAGE